MTIGAYKTACAHNHNELDQQVQELISGDWQPYGNPYAVQGYFCQAMVIDAKLMADAPQPEVDPKQQAEAV
jgi:hypothetical protein